MTGMFESYRNKIKWIANDIPRGLATGLVSEYKKIIYLALRFPAVLPEGVFNY